MSVGARNAVALRGAGHHFANGEWLFRGLDVELVRDRLYAVVGPSGSGKSTLLAVVARWISPSEGQVTHSPGLRTGWVFQNPFGVARRTAISHVMLPLLARGLHRRRAHAEAEELLMRFGLTAVAERPFSQLSGGEGQRLMLARGVAASPGLLLVDEPTAQLDVRTAATVSRTLHELVGQGMIVVVATHDRATRDECTDIIDLTAYAGGGRGR